MAKDTKHHSKANDESEIKLLLQNPSKQNWENAIDAIRRSGAKYYKIFYGSGLKNKDSLKDAYAILYDKSYKRLFKVPIIEISGKSFKGATAYLKGLSINSKE